MALHGHDRIGIPVISPGPGRSGRTPAARRGLLRRKRDKKLFLKDAVAQATR